MNPTIINHIIRFVVYLLLQVTLFRNQVLWDYAFCFIYITPLLQVPIDSQRIPTMFIALIYGLTIDLFYDTLGIHAAVSVFIVYLRPFILKFISDSDDILPNEVISIRSNGLGWFSVYALTFIFLHHILLFFIEASTTAYLFQTIKKIILSTFLTYFVMILIQYLIYPPFKKK